MSLTQQVSIKPLASSFLATGTEYLTTQLKGEGYFDSVSSLRTTGFTQGSTVDGQGSG